MGEYFCTSFLSDDELENLGSRKSVWILQGSGWGGLWGDPWPGKWSEWHWESLEVGWVALGIPVAL